MDFGKKYQLRCALRHDDDEVCGIAICGNTGKIVTSSDRMIRLWTVHGEDLSKTSFDTPASTVRCISWIPPNPTLKSGGVSGCVNNAVVVWDVDSGKIVKTLDHESEVTGIVVDGDDLVSSSIDGNLKRWSNWNCSNCTETWAAHEGPIQAVIKLPTGELVTGSSPILGSRDSSLKIWKGKVCLHTFHGHAFHGHADTVCGLAAMSDFGILSASHDGSLRLWALNGRKIKNMSDHTATVCSVDSHASGLIVSGSEDRLAKIWKDLSCVQSLEHPRSVRDTKFMENGDIVTACSDGLVRIWTGDQNHFASQEELESKLKKRKLNDIDEVADGSEESNRPSFDGVQQDVVPVDIGGKTLQYNRSEVAENSKVKGVDPSTMRFRPSSNMGDTPDLLVQQFNAMIKEKEKVAEKPKVKCVVYTVPMQFRPLRNMGDTTDLWVQRFNAMIKEKEKVAEKPKVECVVNTDPMRFRPSRNMGDMTDLWVQRFNAMIKEKEKVAEKPKVECVVNTDPMRFRPSRNMGDTTDLLVQPFNAMIKEKEKVAAERNVVSVLSPNPFSTGNMDGVAKKKKVESKPCVFTDAFIAEKPDMENVTEEQV